MFVLLIALVSAQNNTTDILSGQGAFGNVSAWTLNSSQLSVMFLNDSLGSKYLYLFKDASASINFREGLYYNFTKQQPQHIQFYFASGNREIEDTNLRLKDPDNDRTVVSFRCGYAGFVRVNDNQMVTFYNNSVSTPTQIYWTKADIIMDWTTLTVGIWINDTNLGSANFYHSDITGVSQLLVYNLYPGTQGWFKNVVVCPYRCNGFSLAHIIGFVAIVLLN